MNSSISTSTTSSTDIRPGQYVRVPEFDRELKHDIRHPETFREGVVERIDTDPNDGVTYLHILQIRVVWDGDVIVDRNKKPSGEPEAFRTPVNGTKTMFGKTLGRVEVVTAPWDL